MERKKILRRNMKKLIIGFVLVLFLTPMAWGAAYITCDCQDYVGWYDVKINSANPIQSIAVDGSCPVGQKRMSFQVDTMPDGQYNLEIRAANMWGESAYVPFDFSKAVPGTPSGIGLSASP